MKTKFKKVKPRQISKGTKKKSGKTVFGKGGLNLPDPKIPISLRIDSDVLNWFKEEGEGYQTRMNAVLRLYMESTK